MNAWEDSTEGGSEWTDVLQTVEKILYACAISEDIKFVSYAAKKLHKMLSRRNITNVDEASYEIGCLNVVYRNLLQRGIKLMFLNLFPTQGRMGLFTFTAP